MNWKEFFKSDKRKFIILGILIIVTFISTMGKITYILCIEGQCPQTFPSGNILFVRTNDVLAFPYILSQEIKPEVKLVPGPPGGFHIEFLGIDFGGSTSKYQFIEKSVDTIFFILGIILNIIYLYIIASVISHYFKSRTLKYRK